MGLGKRTRPATYVSRETEANELGQGLQVSAALGQAVGEKGPTACLQEPSLLLGMKEGKGRAIIRMTDSHEHCAGVLPPVFHFIFAEPL